MINNLNLDNIKVVIFDYDGTLAVHRDKDFPKANSYNAIKQHIEFKITDTDKPLELFEICWAFNNFFNQFKK